MVKKLDTVKTHTFALNEEDVLTIIDALYEYGDDVLADELSGLIEEECKCDDKQEVSPEIKREYDWLNDVNAFDKLMNDIWGVKK